MTKENINNRFGARQHFLDWLRVLAFAYLVLYHTGMMFVEWNFHIESGHDSSFLRSIMLLSSNWRLDLLFLVSGVAISVMMTKMTIREFLWQRVIKLFIPATFAIAVIVTPQSYYEALFKGLIEPGYWQFWANQYFTFTWLEGMIAPFPTYNHMWYVVYLFTYTVILVPLFMYINSENGKRTLGRFENWLSEGIRVLWVPYILYLAVFLYTGHNDITHAINDDWFGHFIYAYILIMGVLFVRMPKCWQAFEDIRYWSLTLALTSYGVIMIKYNWNTPLDVIPWDFVEMIIKWSWVAMLIGFARRYLSFANSALKYCNSIVYPFFILHQTVTIVIGYYIIDWGLNGPMEFVVIAAGTYVICLLLIEIVIKRLNILRLLFGLKLKKKEREFALNSSSS